MFALQVLEAVLQTYPKDATSYDVLSRRAVIHSLEAESQLTELLLRSVSSCLSLPTELTKAKKTRCSPPVAPTTMLIA